MCTHVYRVHIHNRLPFDHERYVKLHYSLVVCFTARGSSLTLTLEVELDLSSRNTSMTIKHPSFQYVRISPFPTLKEEVRSLFLFKVDFV